jgi:large subunit ribosomal protein L54
MTLRIHTTMRTLGWLSWRLQVRAFSTRSVLCQATGKSTTTQSTDTPKRPVSSVPEGTVFKGLNYMREGKDPVAMADDAYPDWLWTLLTPRPPVSEMEGKKKLRRINRENIKANNFLKSRRG